MARSPARAALAAGFVVVLAMSSPADAAQGLIPSPYPSAAPGGAPLNPEPTELGAPQTILRDPYPQTIGDEAQGNPPIIRRHRRQHLVPSIYKRKYRVERH